MDDTTHDIRTCNPPATGEVGELIANCFREFCIHDWNKPSWWGSEDTARFVERLTARMNAALSRLIAERNQWESYWRIDKGDAERWQQIAKEGSAKCTPEHTWAEWVADRNAEITRLLAERDEAREALRPFAAMVDHWDVPDDVIIYTNGGQNITAGDLRRARSALPDSGGEK